MVVKALQSIVLTITIAILIPIFYEVWHQRPAFESNVRKVDAIITHAEYTLKSTDEAVAQWNKASKVQIQASTSVLTQTNQTLVRFQSLVSNMDVSLTTLLSQSTMAIDQQNQSLLETQLQLRKELVEMEKTTIQLQTTLAQANLVLSDPNITTTLASLSDGVKQLDESATDVRIVADKFRDDFTKPANRAWAAIKAIIGLGGQAGAISLLHK